MDFFRKARNRFAGIRDPDRPRWTKPGQPQNMSMKEVVRLGERRFRVFCHAPRMLENVAPGHVF